MVFTRTLVFLSMGLLAATLQAQAPATPPTAGATTPAATPKPFSDVIKDTKELPGYFTLYQKDEKVWLELKPEQIEKPFYLQINRTRGIGERSFLTSPMLRAHIVEFRKQGNHIQLVAKNSRYIAKEGSPIMRAVRDNLSDSLLASASVASLPHPERKSVLVDANALLLADLPAVATILETQYRIPYTFDARNSSFTKVRNTKELTAFEVAAHYSVPKIAPPPLVPNPQAPTVAPPALLEDVRSLFVGFLYSFTELPTETMHPRLADARLGHFFTRKWDFGNEMTATPTAYYVNRWRLEKKDPQAALSEPKQPIVYWLDRNIPEKYRGSVRAGILEWNKAFARIGFKDAIRVEQQSEDADFSTGDARRASVRWMVNRNDGALAIGPSRVDPRSGEILDADIEIEDGWARLTRYRSVEQYPLPQANHSISGLHGAECQYSAQAMAELTFALDLLEARGAIEPDSPEAEAIVQATIKDVTTHEVGHTLGLQHNFRASTIYTPEQISSADFTRNNGLTGSVMDYNAVNLALKGEKQGEYVMSTLGPYDYWAVEYAYKPLAADQEKAELDKIASRNNEPQLAFGNDIDYGGTQGMDPQVNQRDLGNDPLVFAQRRFMLSQELWQRLQNRQFKPGESYHHLRRNFESGLTQTALAAGIAAKFIGGVTLLRDHAGSGRDPITPIPANRQRMALKLLTDGLFSINSFQFSPSFVRRMSVDHFDRYLQDSASSVFAPDISLTSRMLNVHKNVLDQLMSDAVAIRIIDAEDKLDPGQSTLRLSELYDSLQKAIWSELASGKEISAIRRGLQREHLRRIGNALTRTSTTTPADARALQRENARTLLVQLKAAQKKTKLSKEALAHISESANTLEEALKASIQRTGV